MKTNTRRPMLWLLALLGAAALAARCQAGPDEDKLKEDAKAALEKTKDTVKDAAKIGAEKAGEVATNVVADVKVGAQKAGEFATNAAARTKEAVTNAAEKVKEKVHDATK